jgi:acetoin utilization protein AcuB
MRREFIALLADESLLEAHHTMRLARLRHLFVVGEDGALVGIVSYRDLQDDALARAEREPGGEWRAAFRGTPIRDAMVPAPYVVRPEAAADDAVRRMLSLRVGCLPVCESGDAGLRLVGILAESDLLRAAWRR